MPGSLNTVVQFLGRAMRLKGDDYPAAQRDRARLVFFVPCGGGAALADLSLDHSRHALLTCCFLADHEVGQEWIVLREVRRGIEAALGTRTENPAAADAENEADEALDPEVRAEVELVMAAAREEIVSGGGEATVGEVVKLAATTRPDLPEEALHRVAAEILAAQTTPAGEEVREAIKKGIAIRLRIDPMVKKAMAEAFAVVLEAFRDVTLNDSAVLESVGRQVHGVTGGQMREFAQRLREAMPRPLTEEQILSWADRHRERTSEWPMVQSGPVVDTEGDTWSSVNAALQEGLRGLPGGSSLARLLEEKRGVRNRKALPGLTIDQILAWVDSHYRRTGKWPNRDSGQVVDAPGEVWGNVNAALHQGARGLPARLSLAQLLDKHRGVPNRLALPDLTKDQVLAWADLHHLRTKRWPLVKSGPVVDEPGEKWNNIDAALARGGRSLPGGSSLAQLLLEHRDVRNRASLPDLTIDQILAWADAHHARTGLWPKLKSGPIADSAGETWYCVNSALQQSLRGLPGGSSLARLLDKHRKVRNMKGQPRLTLDQILAWAEDHRERIGRWPTLESGLVAVAAGEKWRNIDNALKLGLRGLPGGSSLARVIQESHGDLRS
jgi:pyrroloquinoline quinone (PQQ) biosynthesis protein C